LAVKKEKSEVREKAGAPGAFAQKRRKRKIARPELP